MKRILVLHTAFPGDIVQLLPMLQVLHARIPAAEVVTLTTPAAAGLLANHPAVGERITYDKRGADSGPGAFLRIAGKLRRRAFDLALVPHRSLRSAALCAAARIPRRIGFSTSAGRAFLTDRVAYNRDVHESARNMDLLAPLGIVHSPPPLPVLHPGGEDRSRAESYLTRPPAPGRLTVALAPGSVWATKRWPEERYAALARALAGRGHEVVLVGGEEDEALCSRIVAAAGGSRVRNAAGRLPILSSAALIGMCDVLVSNDSAPMHLAVAMGTPVVAIFGPTSPAFGFAPLGARDTVLEIQGLSCRPCAIHGGPRCPVGTFECMLSVSVDTVLREAEDRGPTKKGGG